MKVATLLLATATAAAAAGGQWIRTPAGFVHEDCHHTVPSGAHMSHNPITGAMAAFHPDGTVVDIPLCAHQPAVRSSPPAGAAVAARSRRTLHNKGSDSVRLPADYDGWLEYTAFRHNDTLDAFLGNFSVPDLPSQTPQILYLFTGLQNIDWIPKVDPEPTRKFDIIQPVLQFPGDYGNYWSVKSWYVTVDIGTVASEEAQVKSPGKSVVFGNMTRTGPSQWFVGSTILPQGDTVQVTVDHPRLTNQPWAYNTLECYGCSGCGTYPKEPSRFTGLQLSAGGEAVPAKWEANPKPAKDRQCKEGVDIYSSSRVDITFQ